MVADKELYIKTTCIFCNLSEDIKNRIFYKKNNWFAFLAAPSYVSGHTILCADKEAMACPQALTDLKPSQLETLGSALNEVIESLKKVYKIKNVLFASLRGNVTHFHFHLIPLHKEHENDWRKKTLHEKGHLFEYLGDLEKEGNMKASLERIEKRWDEKIQRIEISKKLGIEVEKLRQTTKYKSTF